MTNNRRTQYPAIYSRKKQLVPGRYSQQSKSKCDRIQYCLDSEGKRTETLWIFPLPFRKAAKTWRIRRSVLCRKAASVVRDTAEMLLPEKGVWKLIKFLSMSYISLEVYTIFEILPKTVISQYIEFFCLRLFQKFVDYSFASNINLQDRTHSYSSYKYTSASTGHWCGSFLFHQDYMLKIG